MNLTDDLLILPAEESDMLDIFNLSNDIEVRKNSFNSEQIKLEDHIKWIKSKLKDENCVFYTVKTNEGKLAGQVRFDKNRESNDFVISINLSSEYRGKGLGSFIIKSASDKLKVERNVVKVIALIKKENRASLKSFLKAGYKDTKEVIINNIESYELCY